MYRHPWGDGQSSIITAYDDPDAVHTYTSPGIYEVTISGTIDGWRFFRDKDEKKLQEIKQWGCLRLSGSGGGQFWGCRNLIITAQDIPDISGTTDLSGMFSGCESLTVVPNMNLWNTSHVTDLSARFFSAHNFNTDISDWVVSHVTNMRHMFYNSHAFNQPIGGWEVTQVTNFNSMFQDAHAFNQDLTGWDVSHAADLSWMFSFASSFSGDISTWQFDPNSDIEGLLPNASLFTGDITGWNVSRHTNLSSLLYGTTAFDRDIGSWDISQVTDLTGIFNASGISKANYDAILISRANQNVRDNVTMGAHRLTYSLAAVAARDHLITVHGWTIWMDSQQ